MTYERQQRIRRLLEEVARLQHEEAVEQSMIEQGWSPLPNGGFRRPAPRPRWPRPEPWWERNGEFRG